MIGEDTELNTWEGLGEVASNVFLHMFVLTSG